MRTVVYPVKDLAAAKDLYTTLLGVAPSVDAPYYVGFDVADGHVGLDPNGHGKGMPGPVWFWDVDDLATALEALTDAGAETLQHPTDVGAGLLVAMVRDADGNVTGLRQLPEGTA